MYNEPDPHTKATFQALVDALIPSTPEMAQKYGTDVIAGAVDLEIDEYVIWELDHSLSIQASLNLKRITLSAPVAVMLDSAAAELINRGKQPSHPPNSPYDGPFTTLSRKNRIRTLALLEQLDIDLGTLPPPFNDNARLVVSTIDVLNRYTVFGYYSEWSGYGTTRLNTPEERRLEHFPVSWVGVGYPGPAFGYRNLRGFLLQMSHVRGIRP